MSKFVVDLSNAKNETSVSDQVLSSTPNKRGGCWRIFKIFGILAVIFIIIATIGGFFYWQSVKKTPQYSLALLVDAARKDDKEKVSQIIDTEQVVNNFVPQITDKAVELYGRNLSPTVISKVSLLVIPLMPAIKGKAQEELPPLIREKTQKFEKVPYWVIALGADRALDIKIDGDSAQIKSKDANNPLEIRMKHSGQLWKVVEVKDERISRKIAEKVGQQLMTLASKGNLNQAGEVLGVENLGNLLKDLNNIFK